MANRPPYPGTPRWVKVFGIIAIVVVLLFVIMLLTGHGPGRHTPSGHASGQVPSSGVMEEHAPPEGG
jgi:ABC-type transporter Mla subunit MlaD